MLFNHGGQLVQTKWWEPNDGILGSLLSFDTETEKTTPGKVPKYVIGQCYPGNDIIYFICQERLGAFFGTHKECTFIMHNAPFDIAVVEREIDFDFDSMIREQRLWDTGIMYRLNKLAVDGVSTEKWGLKNVVRETLDYDICTTDELRHNWGQYINSSGKAAYDQITRNEFQYAAIDALVTYDVYICLKQDVGRLDSQCYLSHKIQLMGAVGLHSIELNGIGFDIENRNNFFSALNNANYGALDILKSQGFVPNKYENQETLKLKKKSNNGITKIYQKIMLDIELELGVYLPRTEKTNTITQKKEHLEPFRDQSSFINAYLDHKEIEKLKTFMEKLTTSRIYSKYSVLKRTGRTSSYGPNLQQLPRKPGIRECFIPTKGYCFLILDFSQIELVTLGQECIDRYGASKMAEIINKGTDLHRWFAGILLNKSTAEISGAERQQAKACNFGFPGGLGTRAFVAYANTTYGVDFNEEKATQCRQKWIDAFPEMKDYLEDNESLSRLMNQHDFISAKKELGDWWESETAAKMFIRLIGGATESTAGNPYKDKYFDWAFETVLPDILPGEKNVTSGSPKLRSRVLKNAKTQTRTGRIRSKCTYCQARNTPFQGLASDGAKIALYRLYKAGYRVVNFIHDEFIIEIPLTDNFEETGKAVEAICIDAMKAVVPDVKVKTEWVFTDRWYKDAKAKGDEGRKYVLKKDPEMWAFNQD